MCVQNFMETHSIVIQDILQKINKMSTSQGIAKVIRILPLGQWQSIQ